MKKHLYSQNRFTIYETPNFEGFNAGSGERSMLKGAKKSILLHPTATHVDVFVEHYDVLKGWALQFTEHDHEFAEDLLHDTFIQFTLAKPDFRTIQNLEGYLYVMMRNLHLSQLRKAGRTALRPVKVVDFESVDISFWASDPRDRIRMRDELAAVCQFACIRKESARSGSVLIMRFFHGYYPEEIAKVFRASTHSVTMRLQAARNEVRVFLDDPSKLAVLGDKSLQIDKPHAQILGDDLRLELRKQIFASRRGECMPTDELHELYASDAAERIDHRTAAHIVSCPNCIESVNTLLDLPLLASRYSVDMLGYDPGDKGDGGNGGGGSGGGPKGGAMLDSYIRRRDAHFHHQPEELGIAINGQIQTFQKVVAGKGESTLVIDVDESLGFIEVFSEVGFRLLMMNVEPPPVGDGKQYAHIDLSGGRTIDANLNFSGAHPTLQISYNDPQTVAAEALEISTAPQSQMGNEHVPFADAPVNATFIDRLRGWFEPMRIAIASAVLLMGMISVWFLTQPATVEQPVVRVVLKQAREAELTLAPTAERVLHRNYQVEEWTNGDLRSRRRVDEWQKPNATARRTYDEQGRMIAGKWETEDGKQQIFEQGEKLKTVSPSAAKSVPPAPTAGDLKAYTETITPSANAFANLLDRHGVTARTTVIESDAVYTFNFEDRSGETVQAGIPERLIAATLTLDKNSYMPTSQTIVLQIGSEQREYRFSDVRLEQKPIDEVSPLIFLPEAELTKGATEVTKPILSVPPAPTAGDLPTDTTAPKIAATSAEEVEVLDLLNRVGADITEQLNVTRTADGRLLVEGLVESDKRKAEILNALAPVRNNPAIRIRVQTLEEAAKALAKQKAQATPGAVEQLQAQKDAAIDPQLREYFEKQGADPSEAVSRLAGRVIGRSQGAVFQASALNRMANRFNADQLKELDAASRAKWLSILKRYASAVRRETAALRNELDPIFGGFDAASGSPPAGGGVDSASVDGVVGAARRLYDLAAANDRTVRSAFTFSSGGASVSGIKSAQFRRSVAQAEALAAAIERAR